MTVHKHGSVRHTLIFKAQKSNFHSWFERTLLTHSSWVDLPPYKHIRVFSMKGPCKPERGICNSFRITLAHQARYGFCRTDYIGWIYRGTFQDCDWEKDKMHKVFYCGGPWACYFNKKGEIAVRSHEICPGLHAIILRILRKLATTTKKNSKGREDQSSTALSTEPFLRTVPTIAIAHTFCASPDTRISYRQCLLIQGYFCAVSNYAEKVDLSKYSWYPKRKLGVTTHF